jgi:3-deoxy-manno-octulosonate cytidylyltransferase (CMP-KDO synthetase)
MKRAIGVIPARWGSTRFPGKPLAMISGKPLLQWVIEGSKTSRKLQEICVATDDERIAKLAESCGARAVMTNSDLPTGTDRVFQAALNVEGDVIVNIQGDEPLIDGALLDQLVEPFERDDELEMATLGRALDDESLISVNTAKIVLNAKGEALYFSRFPIPYSRTRAGQKIDGALKHIGIYAYRRNFLARFCAQPPTLIEKLEGLEQLRALYLGARIKVVSVEHDSWGVDTPDDVQKIEKIIQDRSRGAKL